MTKNKQRERDGEPAAPPPGAFTVDDVIDEAFRTIGELTVTRRLASRAAVPPLTAPPDLHPVAEPDDEPAEGG